MNEKLELLALSKKYQVTREEKTQYSDGGYQVEPNENLGAFISDNNEITYYVTDCYNSGIDWMEIDIKALEELKKFCELMVK